MTIIILSGKLENVWIRTYTRYVHVSIEASVLWATKIIFDVWLKQKTIIS